ncbi:MAG TPA: hypothetical protein VLL69_00275 [Streptosporangiaceae bacterium]|nr:hypothetical protein [Streptosporangiaceae bacterium]
MTEFPDIPGGRIAYGTCGTGPLVLLAHGPGDMRQAYRFLAPALTGAGYQVATQVATAVLPFLAGHAEDKRADSRQP